MIPEYNTVTFNDVYPNVDSIVSDYHTCGFPTKISDESMKTTYYLLVARYGNNPIANQDINQFKVKLFAIVFQYAPTWEKRLEIQDKLRGLSDDELMKGATNIYNLALNPAEEPTAQSKEELAYINQQNVNKYMRAKPDAYAMLFNILRTDVTENYIDVFKKLFKVFVAHEQTLLYSDEDCEE